MSNSRKHSQTLVLVFLVAIIAAAVGFSLVEKIPLGDAFYFSLVTVTTVGYGDIHPFTPLGKVLAVLLILGGVGLFTGVVASVTEIIITSRERAERLVRLNIIVGLFFQEAGTDLLKRLARADRKGEGLRPGLLIDGTWKHADFVKAEKTVAAHRPDLEMGPDDFRELNAFLEERKTLFLRLLENPNLMEHESFTDLLQAILHFREELGLRGDFSRLPEADLRHLNGDANRVLVALLGRWVRYMEHLKTHHPYLFSLATRTNPFDEEASPIFR